MIKKDNEVRMVEGFNLVKTLQGKLDVKTIMKVTNLSSSTVHRMLRHDKFQDYRKEVTALNLKSRANRKSQAVIKPIVVTPIAPVSENVGKQTVTKDISQMGEITTMSLLNAILGELKKLNMYAEGNKPKRWF